MEFLEKICGLEYLSFLRFRNSHTFILEGSKILESVKMRRTKSAQS